MSRRLCVRSYRGGPSCTPYSCPCFHGQLPRVPRTGTSLVLLHLFAPCTWSFMVHQPVWHHRTCPTCRRSGSSSTCDTSLAHLQTSHSIDVVCSALVHNFSRNMGYPFPVIPTKSAYNYPITVIIYTYIYMTHYKLLILILSTYKYVASSYTMSSFFIEKYF
jgi:hypothetical protein